MYYALPKSYTQSPFEVFKLTNFKLFLRTTEEDNWGRFKESHSITDKSSFQL